MGQRDGFARSDLLKINKMYNCDASSNGNAGGSGNGGIVRPPRPNGNGFNQAFGGFISGVGSFISALGGGGKHDENEIHD